jgi:Tol biopolymer transport system component
MAVHDLAGHIMYTRTVGNEDEHITFLADADGANERELTLPPYSGPSRVSPDAKQILLFTGDGPNTAEGKGGTIGIDGSGYAVLPIHDPTLNYVPQAWSPDGARIAFEGWDPSKPNRNGIYTAGTDGKDIVRVTSHEGPHEIPLDYSPDGKQIVFYRAAVEEPEPWDLGGTLWVVNVDGSGARPIETPGVMPSPAARWSPDGSKILFSTARAQQTGVLWTVGADGSNLTKVFQDADPNYAYGRYATGPVWSPDGSQIMFSLNPIADWFAHPKNGIYVISADGSGLTEVIGSSDFKGMVEWWAS